MANKSVKAFYLPSETIEALKSRAQAIGAGESELAELLIRFGLTHLKNDVARAYLERKRTEPGPLPKALRKNERTVMAVLDLMTREAATRGAPPEFSVDAIADRGGLYRKEGFLALNSCRLRGLVHCQDRTVQRERFKKETVSMWWLASVADSEGRRQTAPGMGGVAASHDRL